MTQTPKEIPSRELKLVAIPRKLHKKLKVMAGAKDTTIQALCTVAVEKYLEAQ